MAFKVREDNGPQNDHISTHLRDLGGSFQATGDYTPSMQFTVDDLDADILLSVAHGFADTYGPFTLTTTDTLPDGLSEQTDYWFTLTDDDHFCIADSFENAQNEVCVDIADIGIGVHQVQDSTEFFLEPGPDEIFRIARVIVTVQDGPVLAANRYGKDLVLVDGVRLAKRTDSEIIVSYTNDRPVLTNAGWAEYCFDADVKAWGPGDEFLTVRWTFTRAGQFMRLLGEREDPDTGLTLPAQRISIMLNDDFTGLTNHTFLVQGYVEYTGS